MADELKPIILTFGGGLNTRRRSSDININECTSGENFDLDPQLLSFQKRPNFDLVATAPNMGEIRGFAQLVKADGTVSTLIQAAGNVYSWDHQNTFTLVGTVSAGAKLRGPREHNFTLDEYVIITDLTGTEVVKKWDGTTFANLAHNLLGTFKAKYCRIHQERAFYGNIINGASNLPHLLVGSEREDAESISVTDRPASTLNPSDPFFLTSPDLRPINGLEEGFGIFLISTKRGRLYKLKGASAFDFAIDPLYDGSSVSGDEAIVNVGNDIALGLPARIESLSGTLNFGDVEADDLSLPISNIFERTVSWTLSYDRKRKLLYCFPDNQAAVYVFFKKLVDQSAQISPWAKWTTGHAVNFQPTSVMSLINPSTQEDLVYFGDASGNIFQMYGEGSMDGGTTNISASRTTGLIRGLPEGNVMDVEGWILYRRQFETTVTLTFEFAGEGLFDKSLTINLPEGDDIAVYNGTGTSAAYYNDDAYYGRSFSDRISRQKFGAAGLNAFFQIRIDVESAGAVDIQEIGLKIKTAK